MSEKDRLAHRLVLLGGVEFSPTDLEIITSEIEDMERILTELEQFAQETPWVFLRAQPRRKETAS